MSEEDDSLRDLYQDLILDHGRAPRNFQALENPDHEAVGHNPLCGDKIILSLKLDASRRIAQASFQGEGCAISTASASMMTEILKGKTIEDAKALWLVFEEMCKGSQPSEEMAAQFNEDDLLRLTALSGVNKYPVRVKCATLAWRTLLAALDPTSPKSTKTE